MSEVARLRVLHVIASLSPVHGGTTSSVLQMIAGLEAQGVMCEVATSDDDGPGRRLGEKAPERQLPGRHYFAKRRDFYAHTPDMAPWLMARVGDYDLVHIHGLFSHVNGLAGRACRRRGVPYIVTPHGMANRYGMRHKPMRKALSFALVERQLLKSATMIHMTSRGEEGDFAALNIATPLVRVPLAIASVPPGDATAFRVRHPHISGRRLAVFMGRLHPIKNLEAAIDALALPGGADFHLVVCGNGPEHYAASLEARAEARGVAERISWLGFVAGTDKANVLAAGDVYLQPSLSESFGMAAVEAVSAGLPCVLGENVAIAKELVGAGFAVAVPSTGEGVGSGIAMAANLKREDRQFSQRARRFVTTNFASTGLARKLAATYERICRSKTGRA